jgi:Toprim domain
MRRASVISWSDVEQITNGRLGAHDGVCPLCSHSRRKRHEKKLRVWLDEPDFAGFKCAHCGAQGHVHPERASATVIDPAELQRRREQRDRQERERDQERTASALRWWDNCLPFFGSPADLYLRAGRGIGDWLDQFRLDDLRYHPNCRFADEYHPAMVALVRNIKANEPVAIHRTALTLDNPPVRVAGIKKMSWGPVKGGAVKLSADDEVTAGLLIGEGIETVLSASSILELLPAWSVISASGIASFPALSGIESLTVAVDNDKDGAGQRAADELIERLKAAGIEPITIRSLIGKDFNDALMGGSDE